MQYIILILVIMITACTNPFAPGLKSGDGGQDVISDQTTVEGVFQNFRYAYITKDTMIYGRLLAPEFTFVYRNHEKALDVSWGREEDMLTTYRMFQSVQNIDLIWNEVLISVGDSTVRDISRSFVLTITFNPSDVYTIFGRANMRLQRNDGIWQILRWRDESNY